MPLERHHERLIHLICILPGPDNQNFWKRVAAANDVDASYVYEKMSFVARFAQQPVDDGGTVSDLAEYVIKFFGGQRRDVWDAIAHNVFSTHGDDSVIGRVFAEDLVRTAQECIVQFSTEYEPRKVAGWARY